MIRTLLTLAAGIGVGVAVMPGRERMLDFVVDGLHVHVLYEDGVDLSCFASAGERDAFLATLMRGGADQGNRGGGPDPVLGGCSPTPNRFCA